MLRSVSRRQGGRGWQAFGERKIICKFSLKTLRKQVGFRWKLYVSRMAFIESSTKARWLSLKALRKQDGFCWRLYESKMAFVQSSTKARWLSFKALWKSFKKRVNCDNTEFHDKIAYVGGPSFRRRPWPFGERRSHARATCATLSWGTSTPKDKFGNARILKASVPEIHP